MRKGGFQKDHSIEFAEYRKAAQERRRSQSKSRLIILTSRLKKPLCVSLWDKTSAIFSGGQLLCITCSVHGSPYICQICEQPICNNCVQLLNKQFTLVSLSTDFPTCTPCYDSMMRLEREKRHSQEMRPSQEAMLVLKCYTTAAGVFERAQKSLTHFHYLTDDTSTPSSNTNFHSGQVIGFPISRPPHVPKLQLESISASISKDLAILRQLLAQMQSLGSHLASFNWQRVRQALLADYTNGIQALTVSYGRVLRILEGADAGLWAEVRLTVRKLSVAAKTCENFQRIYGACFEQLTKVIEEDYQRCTSSTPDDTLGDADHSESKEAHFEGTLMRQTLSTLRLLLQKCQHLKAARSVGAIEKFINLLSQEYEGTLQAALTTR